MGYVPLNIRTASLVRIQYAIQAWQALQLFSKGGTGAHGHFKAQNFLFSLQGPDTESLVQSPLAQEPSGLQDEVQQRIQVAVAAELVGLFRMSVDGSSVALQLGQSWELAGCPYPRMQDCVHIQGLSMYPLGVDVCRLAARIAYLRP